MAVLLDAVGSWVVLFPWEGVLRPLAVFGVFVVLCRCYGLLSVSAYRAFLSQYPRCLGWVFQSMHGFSGALSFLSASKDCCWLAGAGCFSLT